MLPVDFKYRLMYLGKPAEMTDEECSSLPVWHDGERYVSCWKLNAEELKHIQETGTIYIMVTGSGHPPICPSIECPIEGDFNIKADQEVRAKYRNPYSGEMQPVSGKVVEVSGTYYINMGDTYFHLAHCKEIEILNA